MSYMVIGDSCYEYSSHQRRNKRLISY